ncbi:ArpU family phage packaging/lysis transcriptional regulator [Cohnella lubricantis]|uniref:Transcriptional regulator n=1 Tax=Cohnella lubricantis TaxID=2163172 RepID=A0A841T9K9_9BACL|nr:ArpU family phage packaging/lysis transcriptional regulator [Cohnella lubricantis]MBB6675940.1 transcriptional regulator [Cohnella lubricantis]MBP2117944.1 ArpU family phage transcriptional regulator [Cohnella lubricantis]
MEQLSLGADFLPELDRKATQKAVEAALERYRLYKYLTFDEREASITASYELREGGRTNVTPDQTASIALHNVDEQERRRAYCERIERAVSRLPRMERFLITERYLASDAQYLTDYNVYTQQFQPPISEGYYSKIRWRAFYKLALSLNLAVIKGKEDEA